jgi:hypothetical protein
MNDFSGFGCLSLLCLTPIITFTLGVLIGKNKIPFRVRIERTGTDIEKYEVDDGSPDWK